MELAEVGFTDVGALIAALMAAMAAVAAAIINWQLYRSQTDPQVIVYVKHDESRPGILLLVIENVGRGLAQDVTFHLSEPIPAHAWGMTEDEADISPPMAEGPLIHGIRSMGPGSTRIISWGQYGGLSKALGGRVVYINCNCRNTNGAQLYPVVCALEMWSFALHSAVDPDGARQSAQQLERVADMLNNLTNFGRGPLPVRVQHPAQAPPQFPPSPPPR